MGQLQSSSTTSDFCKCVTCHMKGNQITWHWRKIHQVYSAEFTDDLYGVWRWCNRRPSKIH